jgi:hypothetical protein
MPRSRIPVLEDGFAGWTQVSCDWCEAGAVWFDPNDGVPDGAVCDGCELAMCERCYDGRWTTPVHRAGLFCDACVRTLPPHDAATCATCALLERARADKLARDSAKRAADDASVWPRMLACVRGVSERRAAAIAAAFPSPQQLLDGYADARKRGVSETALVADVPMPDGKRVGPSAAGAVRRAMLADST